MINYPAIDPIALKITPTWGIHWYGILYLLSFGIGWWLLRSQTRGLPGWSASDKLSDLIFYVALGVIIGGRVGYMLFYVSSAWCHDPLLVVKIWEGGMSFHGGLVGVLVGLIAFSRRYKEPFWGIADQVARVVPVGLALGRLGNFINGELWGTVTNLPWGMVFPRAGAAPRHPYPIYAMLLEGIVLFVLLRWYAGKPRVLPGRVSGLFLCGYGVIRILEEWVREPDLQYGYLAWGWVTMGQLLCVPMVFAGAYLLTSGTKLQFSENR